MNSLSQVDELVKEYLLFRGFINTFRALEIETKTDKDKGFQVDRIIEELLGFITNGDIHGLVEYYRYLDLRFFSRLDSRFQRTVKKFELCLLRHYLVHAIQNKKKEKVTEFFDIYGSDLQGKQDWVPWFALPYMKNPSSDPAFETFFTKYWVDNYTISLHNFLATTFQNMPLPSLLSFNLDRLQRKSQQTEIEGLKSTVETQKATLEARDNDIAKLKHQISETKKEMTDGMSFIRRRAASSTLTDPILPIRTPTRSHSTSTVSRSSTQTPREEPFLIVGQADFYEHASAITHAKFSSQGDYIASCDMDHTVKIWNYKDTSSESFKIKNSPAHVLSLEWDARSDKFLYLGTDTGLIRVYNMESKSVVQEFLMDETYPWIHHITSSPVEPVFICTGANSKLISDSKRSTTLVAWSMKSMSACGTYCFQEEQAINTINLNHNGQMLVVGHDAGLMQIFDVRCMKPIIEWNGGQHSSCMAQFSFDENSIYSVDTAGKLSQWSIHKPGECISSRNLDGFPPAPLIPANITMSSSSSVSSKISKRSFREGGKAQSLLFNSPRSQMVTFSSDMDYVLCTSDRHLGAIHKLSETSITAPLLKIGNEPTPHQKITTVDWTNSSNACLFGTTDGTVKVVSLIKA
ncbi:WD40-repeat-containing domain protein [Sporodiniella umbellata]|nr:WD40-repeat-containing domain protein [Sporodiniella umbellata]